MLRIKRNLLSVITALECTYKDSGFLEQVSYELHEAKHFLKNLKVEQLVQIPHLLSNVTLHYHLHKSPLLYLTFTPPVA